MEKLSEIATQDRMGPLDSTSTKQPNKPLQTWSIANFLGIADCFAPILSPPPQTTPNHQKPPEEIAAIVEAQRRKIALESHMKLLKGGIVMTYHGKSSELVWVSISISDDGADVKLEWRGLQLSRNTPISGFYLALLDIRAVHRLSSTPVPSNGCECDDPARRKPNGSAPSQTTNKAPAASGTTHTIAVQKKSVAVSSCPPNGSKVNAAVGHVGAPEVSPNEGCEANAPAPMRPSADALEAVPPGKEDCCMVIESSQWWQPAPPAPPADSGMPPAAPPVPAASTAKQGDAEARAGAR